MMLDLFHITYKNYPLFPLDQEFVTMTCEGQQFTDYLTSPDVSTEVSNRVQHVIDLMVHLQSFTFI